MHYKGALLHCLLDEGNRIYKRKWYLSTEILQNALVYSITYSEIVPIKLISGNNHLTAFSQIAGFTHQAVLVSAS